MSRNAIAIMSAAAIALSLGACSQGGQRAGCGFDWRRGGFGEGAV